MSSQSCRSHICGQSHVCALLGKKTIKCWGKGSKGELGTDDDEDIGDEGGQMGAFLPAVDLGSFEVIQVGVGDRHSCAISAGLELKCWGKGASGQLGNGDTENIGDDSGEMASVLSIDLGSSVLPSLVDGGLSFTCMLSVNGEIKCWGLNFDGKLGLGHTDDLGYLGIHMGDNLPFVDFGTSRYAVDMALGLQHVVVLRDDDSIVCWGEGLYGSLGNENDEDIGDEGGDMADYLAIVDHGVGFDPVYVAAGDQHSIAIFSDGSLKLWGDNSLGQLGQEVSTVEVGNDPGEMGSNLPFTDVGSTRTAIAAEGGLGHTV